jgi:hypothetical protein
MSGLQGCKERAINLHGGGFWVQCELWIGSMICKEMVGTARPKLLF